MFVEEVEEAEEVDAVEGAVAEVNPSEVGYRTEEANVEARREAREDGGWWHQNDIVKWLGREIVVQAETGGWACRSSRSAFLRLTL